MIIRLPNFGKGYSAYEAAKRWLEDTHPELTYGEREQLHRQAAKMAGV